MRSLASFVYVAVLAACRPAGAPAPPTPASAESTPEPALPTDAPAAAPTHAIVKTHMIGMAVPQGWTVTSGDDWAIARDPAGTAAFYVFGWDDPSHSPDHLHRAEAEFGATMPIGVGEIITFPSGLRMAMTLGEALRADGVAVKTLMMSGGSPKGTGGIGAFAFWRADATTDQLAVLQTALDSVAPIESPPPQ